MTIRFNCPGCEKQLKTADDKVGKRAKCPQCGKVVTVPSSGTAKSGSGKSRVSKKPTSKPKKKPNPEPEDDYGWGGDDDGSDGWGDSDGGGDGWGNDSTNGSWGDDESYDDDYSNDGYEEEDDDLPEPMPLPHGGTPCPMCGEDNPSSASRCRGCGESLTGGGKSGFSSRSKKRGQFDPGEVISTSYKLYKKEMGTLVGGMIVAGLCNTLAYGVIVLAPMFLLGFVMGADLNPIVAMVILGMLALIYVTVISFIFAGQAVLLVSVARGNNPAISDLFAGGPYVLRAIGNTLLLNVVMLAIYLLLFGCVYAAVQIAPMLGGIMAIVSPIIQLIAGMAFFLTTWAYMFVLVDQDAPNIQPILESIRLTQKNIPSVIHLMLLCIGYIYFGVLLCGVGILLTMPLIMLNFAVAYCRLAGRSTAA